MNGMGWDGGGMVWDGMGTIDKTEWEYVGCDGMRCEGEEMELMG